MSSPLRYRAAAYVPVPSWRRWWPLARQEFFGLFQTKWGVALFFLCLFPAVGRLVMLLILFGVVRFGPTLRNRLQGRASAEAASFDPERIEFYLEPVLSTMPGMVFVLLLSSLVAARAVARDRTTNALELYWTRGISPRAYFLAKWVGSTLLVGVVTVAVPLALWLTAVFLAEDWSLLLATAPQFGLALCGLTLVTGVWIAVCILISTLCATPNTATVLWCMLLVGSAAMGNVLAEALDQAWLRPCLSVWDAGGVVVRTIAGIPQRGVSVGAAVAVLFGLPAVLVLAARRRLRLVEAIG